MRSELSPTRHVLRYICTRCRLLSVTYMRPSESSLTEVGAQKILLDVRRHFVRVVIEELYLRLHVSLGPRRRLFKVDGQECLRPLGVGRLAAYGLGVRGRPRRISQYARCPSPRHRPFRPRQPLRRTACIAVHRRARNFRRIGRTRRVSVSFCTRSIAPVRDVQVIVRSHG